MLIIVGLPPLLTEHKLLLYIKVFVVVWSGAQRGGVLSIDASTEDRNDCCTHTSCLRDTLPVFGTQQTHRHGDADVTNDWTENFALTWTDETFTDAAASPLFDFLEFIFFMKLSCCFFNFLLMLCHTLACFNINYSSLILCLYFLLLFLLKIHMLRIEMSAQ